jgi:hypothetical protein
MTRAEIGRAAALAAVAVLAAPGARAGAGAPTSTAGEIYAIVVGYNGARPGLPALHYADDDAVRFALLLRGLGGAGRPAHVRLLTEIDADTAAALAGAGLAVRPDGPPTRTALLGALDEVGRAVAAARPAAGPPVLYVIYAGHGLPGRILLEPEGAPEAAITGHELRAAVAEVALRAPGLRTFLFLDACRSQSLFTVRGPDDELGPDLSAPAADLEQRAGAVAIGVLTAASSGKPAGEVRDLGAGYFSHVLASGLAGAADADGDDVVSFGELAAFVAFNTERLTGQRPWFAPPGGNLAAPAIDLRGRGARLELSAAPAGRYLVAAASGRPIFAEAFKGQDRRLNLTLPAGRYRVERVVDAEHADKAEVELQAGHPLDLAGVAWEVEPTVRALRARGDGQGEGDGAPAFSAAFTTEAVSTLGAGYDAGRAPTAPLAAPANSAGLAGGVSSAPLGLGGAEPGLSLRYRRRAGAFFAGARLGFGRSAHAAAGAYHLDRYVAMIEAGPRWSWRDRLELSLVAGAGAATLIRRGSGGDVSGDPLAPAVAGGAGAELRLGGAWCLYADVRYTVQWFSVDGARDATATPGGELGVAFGF